MCKLIAYLSVIPAIKSEITLSFCSFLNNSLLALDNKDILKAYNLVNKKIFWQIDLSKILQISLFQVSALVPGSIGNQ